jgi:hypothetical protein
MLVFSPQPKAKAFGGFTFGTDMGRSSAEQKCKAP